MTDNIPLQIYHCIMLKTPKKNHQSPPEHHPDRPSLKWTALNGQWHKCPMTIITNLRNIVSPQ